MIEALTFAFKEFEVFFPRFLVQLAGLAIVQVDAQEVTVLAFFVGLTTVFADGGNGVEKLFRMSTGAVIKRGQRLQTFTFSGIVPLGNQLGGGQVRLLFQHRQQIDQ